MVSFVKHTLISIILLSSAVVIYQILSGYEFSIPKINPYTLIIAIAVFIISCLVTIPVYKYSLDVFNCKPPIATVISMAFIPQAGKYIPSSAFLYAGLLWYLKKVGFTVKKSLFFLFFLQVLTIFISMILALLIILSSEQYSAYLILPLIFIVLLFMFFSSRSKFKGTNVASFIVSSKRIFLVVIMLGLQVILTGLAYYFLLLSLTEVPFNIVPKVILANSLAIISGILAFFAPGGIGVKEGVLFYFMNEEVHSNNIVIVSVVFFRILMILMDVLLAFLAYLFFHNKVGLPNEK